MVRLSGALFVLAGIVAMVSALLPSEQLFNLKGIISVGLVALIVGLLLMLFPGPLNPIHGIALIVVAIAMVALAGYLAGPRQMPFAMNIYVWASPLIFCVYRRSVASMMVGLMGVAYALLLFETQRQTVAFNIWFVSMSAIVVVGAFVAWIVQHTHEVAVSERRAHFAGETARQELATLNAELEARVEQGIEELSRMGRLKMFLSPHLAEAVVESDENLKPHRKDVSVFFADLRGFTVFASDAEPDEVVEILDGFYRCLGEVFNRYEATVGAFVGDGVMAFLNDPLPCEDPPGWALKMAEDLHRSMEPIVQGWKSRGLSLSYGVGIASGYATLGMIGFDGRKDYTAVGRVVNLASRLCDAATEAQTFVDERTAALTRSRFSFDELEPLTVKGFRDPVAAYRLNGTSLSSV